MKQSRKLNQTMAVLACKDLTWTRNDTIYKAIKYLKLPHVLFNIERPFIARQIRLFSFLLKNSKRYKYIFITARCKNDVAVAKFVSVLFRKRLIVDVSIPTHSLLVEERGYYKEGSWQSFLLKLYDKITIAFADAALVALYVDARYLRNKIHGNGKYFRLIQGADGLKHASFMKKHKKKKEQFTVLYNGTYIAHHGVKYIIQAAARLNSIRFVFYGEGQLYSQSCFLAKKLELENVKFITKYSEDELLSAIDNSDLYIGLVGETDRARRVIAAKTFKGFAMRKCVINGRSGAMDELFEADKDYAAVKFADVDDLVKKIKSLRKNKKEIERIAKHGYETFNKHGDVPTVAEELLSILEAIR